MRGILLAGGMGTRLAPLTRVTNKHLIAVYDEPMIMYPLRTLLDAGIRDILIVSGREHAGHFVEFLGSGAQFGARLAYKVQDEAGGIAQALLLGEDFARTEPVTVILGDNVFEDRFASAVRSFRTGARVFLKEVPDPQRFGVAQLSGSRVTRILEKPKNPPSSLAVTGLYQYDSKVFGIVRRCRPSGRGELEITDVNNAYIRSGRMRAEYVKGFWSDAGTFPSLARTVHWAMEKKLSSRATGE
ncbi:MAG TPA: sugar phosphate nucleotidyltransferase [Candidatus Paceibacterota bacterium]|nr:sugar phosphate nucleotidyltransferase [Candidatus Paceibacterota bacterium]